MSVACALVRNRFAQDIAFRLLRTSVGTAKVDSDGTLATVGSGRKAQMLARRAGLEVPAYRDFAGRNGSERPFLDKADYILRYPVAQMLADDWRDTFTIFRSSGSSGRPQYWPQLKKTHRFSKWAFRVHLEHCFRIHRQKSIAIVGLSLGSWVGGDYVSWVLKCIALDADYPFCVFAPGNHHQEIIEMIAEIEPYVDQIILFLCPSAIGHLHLLAQQKGVTLPLGKLCYVVLGEPFPESLRLSLANRAGLPPGQPFLFSVYGSADTGTLGIESLASVAVRQLLTLNPELRDELGIPEPVPHLFHFCAPDAFLESINGELCVTRWQGIPLVRYNLHDSVRFLDWPTLRAAVLRRRSGRDESLLQLLGESSSAMPSILAIPGRADRCLILCGTNLSETMLDAAVRTPELESVLTGAYEARIEYENDRQFLSFEVELKPGVVEEAGLDRQVYDTLVSALGRVQPEFLDDWQNMYRLWDDSPGQRILRVNYHAWPALSKSTEMAPKQRGIRA
jgi:phenylacetate-CoA ligase